MTVGRKPKAPLLQLRALYESGKSIDEIAKITGLNRSGVSARLRRAGVRMRPRGKAKRGSCD